MNKKFWVTVLTAAAIGKVGLSTATAATYYVSTTGSDACNASRCGGVAAPFRTINFAINTAAAGSTINVAQGTYTDRLIINHSLTIVGPASGTKPAIIDCTTAADVTGKNICIAVVNTTDVSISKFTITNRRHSTDTVACAGNQCPYNFGIFVNTTSTAATATARVKLEQLYFTHIDAPAKGVQRAALGIWITGENADASMSTKNVIVQNNTFYDNAMSADYDSNAIVFTGNSSDSVAQYNSISNFRPPPADHAVGVYATTALDTDGNGPEVVGGGLANHSRRIVVRGNIVRKERPVQAGDPIVVWGASFGFYAQGSQQVLVEGNYFEGCQSGMQVADERSVDEANSTKDIWLRDNVVSNGTQPIGLHSSDLSVGDPTWMFNIQQPAHVFAYRPVKNVYVTNNTFYADALSYSNPRLEFWPGILGVSKFQNNIVYYPTAGFTSRFDLTGTVPGFENLMLFDYNTYFAADNPSQTAQRFWKYTAGTTTEIRQAWASYQSATLDPHSFITAPGFASTTHPDSGTFRITNAGSAYNHGIVERPPWAGQGAFGPYEFSQEADFYSQYRNMAGQVDIGAAEFCPFSNFPACLATSIP
jgi:hypothetical protein